MPPNTAPPDVVPKGVDLQELQVGHRLWRIHSDHFEATEFNPTVADNPYYGGRFDSARGEYSYLYAGESITGACAETLLRQVPTKEMGSTYFLPHTALESRRLTQVEVRRPILLVPLYGPALFNLGQQDSWLTSSDALDYPHTREWAHVIRGWFPDAGGFVWRSRVDNDEFSYVFFGDRLSADSLVKAGRSMRLDRSWGGGYIEAALARYNVEVSAAVSA